MVSVQNAAHGSKTHENWVSVGNKSLKSMFGIIWVRALGSGSELRALDSGLWGSSLGCWPGGGGRQSPPEARETTDGLQKTTIVKKLKEPSRHILCRVFFGNIC